MENSGALRNAKRQRKSRAACMHTLQTRRQEAVKWRSGERGTRRDASALAEIESHVRRSSRRETRAPNTQHREKCTEKSAQRNAAARSNRVGPERRSGRCDESAIRSARAARCVRVRFLFTRVECTSRRHAPQNVDAPCRRTRRSCRCSRRRWTPCRGRSRSAGCGPRRRAECCAQCTSTFLSCELT